MAEIAGSLPGFEHPRTGVGIMTLRTGKRGLTEVLLGKRKGSHAAGQYAFPGGHLENGESLAACARREVREETGLEIGKVDYRLTALIGEYAPAKPYIFIGVTAWVAGAGQAPRLLEPDKCEGWDWYDLHGKLPTPIMGPTALALYDYRAQARFYDLEAAAEAIRQFRASVYAR